MALGYNTGDVSAEFNSLYKVTFDMSGWDKTTIQTTGAVLGTINLMGTNDPGATVASQGNAELAINFSPVQAKNLQTGTSVNAIYGAGLFEVDINARFLQLQGTPAQAGTNVYRLMLFHSKGS